MKKFLGVLLIALMLCSVLFVTISCKEPEKEVPTYTVKFDSQGGTAVADAYVKEGDKVAKPADPTKAEYIFSGWYKEAGCTNAYDFSSAVTQDLTLYAKWAEPVKYTVTFDSQGGSIVAPVQVIDGKTVDKPKDPTRTGFYFMGWFKEAACTNEYAFTTPVTQAITLYAKWIDASTVSLVTFDYNYTGAPDPVVVMVTKGEAVAKPTDPSRTGYYFEGWFKDAAHTEAYDFTTVVNEDIRLYAFLATQAEHEHCDPILPKGVGGLNKAGTVDLSPLHNWSYDPKGMEGLPDFVTDGSKTNVTEELKAAIELAQNTPNYFSEKPTNIIFLFSDGWGVTEVTMSREYKGELILDSLPYASESMTDAYLQYSFDKDVTKDYSTKDTTDSCAGGTQVLAGYKTRYGYISLDVDGTEIMNLVEAAHENGWKTAVVTNDNIVDATPADAMIHDTNRYHSAVLYYKALMYALIDQNLDLLMGWDWGMDDFFNSDSWADKFLDAEKDGIGDAIKRQKIKSFSGSTTKDCIEYFKSLSTADKMKMAGFSIFYHLWENETGNTNSWMRWATTGGGELSQYVTWLGDGGSTSGLGKAIAAIEAKYGKDPADSKVRKVNRYTNFKDLMKQTTDPTFEYPVLGSWLKDGNDYESSSPNRGYLLHGTIGKNYPNWSEMVAYTIYQMDKEADAASTGFFCLVENTCTDGWGHSGNYDTKTIGMLNEVQCFDEGVAIAVKYVLEHPDTLLVISADHETGGFILRSGWENDFEMIKSTTTGHSSQNVPLYAFGAGAENFSPSSILANYGDNPKAHVSPDGKVHEGWITGQLMGQLMGIANFGQPEDYIGQ